MPEHGLGVQTVLRSGISGDHPMSFADTPGGLLLLANGIDPMIRWDGLAGSADNAGVMPPSLAMNLGGIGPGLITGRLVAYQRFIDLLGNVSDLSPVSNLMDAGFDGLIEDVDFDPVTGIARVRSSDHGLSEADIVVVGGVNGIPIVNGSFRVSVIDKDSFTLNGLVVTSGLYTDGGSWTLGIATVVYGNVPVPSEGKVARRQILRNLSGNAEVFYVDIETDDLISTEFSSTRKDADLSASEPVPLSYGEFDLPLANRYGVPPSHKSVIVAHKGRVFAAVDVAYSDGHIETTFNSKSVVGVGTAWPVSLAGRTIYIGGARSTYQVASIDAASQTITLDRPYVDGIAPYSLYSIVPDPGERKLVYYSEPGLPEAWPAYNAIGVVENNDEITALVNLGNFLYVVERRHIHRLTFNADPATDGFLFQTAFRGSLSDRTYAMAEGSIYFLDEIGIHQFDGQDSTPISGPIQTVFQQDETSDISVDWASDQSIWHAAHDPVRDTIRWFVTMVGYSDPYHAICFNYRTGRFWIEQYPTPMTSSANGTIGHRRSLAGTSARRVVCLSEGSYDGVDGTGTLRGNPTSADSVSITDTSASFAAVEGAPVSIVDGTGRGQERIIAFASSTRLEIAEPWDVIPDPSSVYQVGGIGWTWRSGWFRYVDDESENPRDVEVVFHPTTIPTLMDATLFFDHALVPRGLSRSIDSDGVRTTEGRPEITIELNASIGWARQRLSGHADRNAYSDRFISVQLSGVQAGAPVRVSQVIINGVEEG